MYTIGYEFLGELRFRLLEIPEFPTLNRFDMWKNWAVPIKNLLQSTTDFKLCRDFETPVADCRLYYEQGQWVISVKTNKEMWVVNSRTKTVTKEVDAN